jgi:hypothetical protein
MVTYRSRVQGAGEMFCNVIDNVQTALDLGEVSHSPVLAVAFGVGSTVLEILQSEARRPQRLNPGGKLDIKRGQTFVFDGDVSTRETVVFTDVGNRSERLVLDSDLGQRLVLDVNPGESIGIRFDPGERITVHNNFRRPLRY